MDKATLTRTEAAELLGVSTATVTEWVRCGRLKAYRKSDKPKSPYLFTKEDCLSAIAFVVSPVRNQATLPESTGSVEACRHSRRKNVRDELYTLLKTRKKK
ncbi:TPA: helix-turn-helix domain-containing protein [Klebsiella variicola]|nr:helix-turn-helix domain-containing protein [Klebsiella variicola]